MGCSSQLVRTLDTRHHNEAKQHRDWGFVRYEYQGQARRLAVNTSESYYLATTCT